MSNTWKWVSAKWWKFDFHNHTPASDDYGKGINQSQYKQITPKEWLLNYMQAGIDCVAVTDHNSGAWIDPLKVALQELAVENSPNYRPLYLFPGIEITTQGNLHLLAIFPLDKSTSDIDSLLGAVKYRATKGKSDGCSECSAVEVITEISRAGGLAIPAHVDKDSGLFTELTGITLSQVLAHKDLIAIEVIDSAHVKPQLYVDKRLKLTEVLGTDSHHPPASANTQCPGSHFTWVKMSEPSFDGLRLALIDGSISIRRSDEFTANPNIHGPLVIESLSVDNAKYLGRGEKFTCHLNPWLNTIIGGRGTGKSTSLEFLRIALRRNQELPKSLESEFKKYSQRSQNRHDEGLLTQSTILSVEFRKDGGRFRISWKSADDRYEVEEETAPGTWNTAEGDIAQRFPVRIYSQKQIFELAKHPQALLKVIDDSPEVNYREWKLEWDELHSRYLSLCAQEREVLSSLQEEPVIKGQLNDIIRKLNVFETSGHTDVLKNYQQRQNQDKAISTWEDAWSNSADRVRDVSVNLLPPNINTQLFSTGTEENEDILGAVAQIQTAFQAIRSELQKLAIRVDDIKKSWQDGKPGLQITQKIKEANEEYASLRDQLTQVGVGTPTDYGQLVKQRQDIEEKLRQFDTKRVLLEQHQRNARECLDQIRSHRQHLTLLRDGFLKSTLTDNQYVQINNLPYANKVSVEEEFRILIGRESGGYERDIGSIDSDEGLLSMLWKLNDQTMEERVDAIKSKLIAIHSNEETAVDTAKDKRFVTHVQGLAPERIDRIRCWFPEDSLDVRYSLKNGEGFKPVDQGSPGQKTAALLAFFFSYGHEPLVLDQPEDDLDNHLIYNLIVAQLREIKQRRQVLIVTHNANIVVNGDAENVLVLDVVAGRTQIIAQGGLQEQSIRDEICRVMEGGKEAFDQRYKRIGTVR